MNFHLLREQKNISICHGKLSEMSPIGLKNPISSSSYKTPHSNKTEITPKGQDSGQHLGPMLAYSSPWSTMTELAFQISISLNWNRRICPSKQSSTTQFDLQYCTSHKCLGQVTALNDKKEKLQYINSHLYMAYKILKGKHICKNALIKYSSKYTSQPQNACPKMESSPALA